MKLPVRARLADPGDNVIVDAEGGYLCATHSGEGYMDDLQRIVQGINGTVTLAGIASTPLWGEHIPDDALRAEHIANGDYDETEGYQPSGDDECTMLRDAVENARMALGLPLSVDMPEGEAAHG